MKVVRPRSTRFRPCATTARLGSYATEVGAVGAVRRVSSKSGMWVIGFSADPMNEAIFRTSSARNSRARPGERGAFLLFFFIVVDSLVLVYDSRVAVDALLILSLPRGIGNKLEGSSYPFH